MRDKQLETLQSVSALTNIPLTQIQSIIEILNLVQLQRLKDGHKDIIIPGIGTMILERNNQNKISPRVVLENNFIHTVNYIQNTPQESLEELLADKLKTIDLQLIDTLMDVLLTKEDLLDLGVDVEY